MTTFSDILAQLKSVDPALALIFRTSDGEIGAGYHVTELRHSKSTGIDCGGRIEAFDEARLQLLDGTGEAHMSVGKFAGIVEKSLAAVPELAEAPVLVEFGHANAALSLLAIGVPDIRGDAIVVPLGPSRAVCKPFERRSAPLLRQARAAAAQASNRAPNAAAVAVDRRGLPCAGSACRFVRDFEGGLLLGAGFGLVLVAPFAKGHAIEGLAAIILGHLDPALNGGLLIPAAQAVSAETCKVHHVDILDISALSEMVAQAAERGGFKLGAGCVIHGSSPCSEPHLGSG